jgi:hypothetical protein
MFWNKMYSLNKVLKIQQQNSLQIVKFVFSFSEN